MVMNHMNSDGSDVAVVNIPPEGSDEDEGNDEDDDETMWWMYTMFLAA